eukprot:CAMPEP_0115234784 /NCGR_PEP_ID=MMETSP0270-20121206/34971_1 /TAXON_ID=71861 /ORGANISM="Scrippsiella trochoidea, Strain CCMP3099" /LENGTH=212 /DNA_ID=CAMNT_0002649541 /DNA_START=226 /DNA_END=860 /DNA_ORIENTATION=-
MSASWSCSDVCSTTLCGAQRASLIRDSIAATRTSEVLSRNISTNSATACTSPHIASAAKVVHALTLTSRAEAESRLLRRVCDVAAAVATTPLSPAASEAQCPANKDFATRDKMSPSKRPTTSQAICHGEGAAIDVASVAVAVARSPGTAGIVGRRLSLLARTGSAAARRRDAGAVTRRTAERAARGATEEMLDAIARQAPGLMLCSNGWGGA